MWNTVWQLILWNHSAVRTKSFSGREQSLPRVYRSGTKYALKILLTIPRTVSKVAVRGKHWPLGWSRFCFSFTKQSRSFEYMLPWKLHIHRVRILRTLISSIFNIKLNGSGKWFRVLSVCRTHNDAEEVDESEFRVHYVVCAFVVLLGEPSCCRVSSKVLRRGSQVQKAWWSTTCQVG